MTRPLDRAVSHLRELATLTELVGGSRSAGMKARAFRGAADALRDLSPDHIPDSVAGLKKIDGIGASAGAIALEAMQGGTAERLTDAREALAPAARVLIRARGLGIRSVQTIIRTHSTLNMAEVREHASAKTLDQLGLSTRAAHDLDLWLSLQRQDDAVPAWHVRDLTHELRNELAAVDADAQATHAIAPFVASALIETTAQLTDSFQRAAERWSGGAAERGDDELVVYNPGGAAITIRHVSELSSCEALDQPCGDGHVHTNLSGDGTAPIQAMAEAAVAAGREWLCVTEHAPNLPMNGVSLDALHALQAQARALEDARGDIAIRIGAELNIALDGTLDWPDDELATLDWTIASIHSDFDAPADVQTARILAAMESPAVRAWAHPTGRRIARRVGAQFDIEAVVEAAVRTETAIEVNGSLQRLDATADLIAAGRAAGARFIASSDAHAPHELAANGSYGLAWARNCGVSDDELISQWSTNSALAWIDSRGA